MTRGQIMILVILAEAWKKTHLTWVCHGVSAITVPRFAALSLPGTACTLALIHGCKLGILDVIADGYCQPEN